MPWQFIAIHVLTALWVIAEVYCMLYWVYEKAKQYKARKKLDKEIKKDE